jgi:hypothetical protein
MKIVLDRLPFRLKSVSRTNLGDYGRHYNIIFMQFYVDSDAILAFTWRMKFSQTG